jgi:hypothetical protein
MGLSPFPMAKYTTFFSTFSCLYKKKYKSLSLIFFILSLSTLKEGLFTFSSPFYAQDLRPFSTKDGFLLPDPI